jgi:hypothetical protein
MKIWAKTDGEVREGKYLVVRRDGTVPKWPHFVIGGDDYAGPAGLRAYAEEARRLGYDPAYCDSIMELADDFAARAVESAATAAQLGTKGADPDAPPHRIDNPTVIEWMRGNGDPATTLRALVDAVEGRESTDADDQLEAMVAVAERARHDYHYEGKAAETYWHARFPSERTDNHAAMKAALRAALALQRGDG